jgi:hypothetical protein
MPWPYRIAMYALSVIIVAGGIWLATMEYRCSYLEDRCARTERALAEEARKVRGLRQWTKLHLAFSHNGDE